MKRTVQVARSAALRGHGHPAIRATHAKTFELTADPDISARATCVVSVGTGFDEATLTSWSLLRGRVRLALTAVTPDGIRREAAGEAVVNPRHSVEDRIVIRRSTLAEGTDDADTWATDSTLTARDFGPELVAALTDAGTEVTLSAVEIGTRRPLVLIRPARTPLTGRARRLAAHDDESVWSSENPEPRRGSRFAFLPQAPGPLVAVEALLAAGLPYDPHAWLGSPQRLSGLPLMPTVFHMPAGTSPELFGDRPIAVADETEQDLGTAMVWLPAAEAVTRVGALAVLGASPEPGELVDLDSVARALVAAGIAPRTLSEALTPLGLSRKKLYQLLKDSQ